MICEGGCGFIATSRITGLGGLSGVKASSM